QAAYKEYSLMIRLSISTYKSINERASKVKSWVKEDLQGEWLSPRMRHGIARSSFRVLLLSSHIISLSFYARRFWRRAGKCLKIVAFLTHLLTPAEGPASPGGA